MTVRVNIIRYDFNILIFNRYILFIRKNALQVLIPKFGLEGTIYLSGKKDTPSSIQFIYNEEEHTQQHKNTIFRAFDPVTIRLSLDASNVQHEKLVFQLVKPYIPGFSADPLDQMELDNEDESKTDTKPIKRKSETAKDLLNESNASATATSTKGKKNKKRK